MVAATDTERWKEAHYRDCTNGSKFVSFALETYATLTTRLDRFLVECAFLVSRGCAKSGPSTNMLCTSFR